MLLQTATWPEVDAYLKDSSGIILPAGSTEQHGPMGAIGTDSLCAQAVAEGVGATTGALVAPVLAYGPAQFNSAFPGTASIRAVTMMTLFGDIVRSLAGHGFRRFYVINGHGGNLAPLRAACHDLLDDLGRTAAIRFRIRSWWDYPQTDALRRNLYGDGEGMHATPSEIAISQASQDETFGNAADAKDPPAVLSEMFLRDHSGDQHERAEDHRRQFPDGRVGSHSALANPHDGRRLLTEAIAEAAADYRAFLEDFNDGATPS